MHIFNDGHYTCKESSNLFEIMKTIIIIIYYVTNYISLYLKFSISVSYLNLLLFKWTINLNMRGEQVFRTFDSE